MFGRDKIYFTYAEYRRTKGSVARVFADPIPRVPTSRCWEILGRNDPVEFAAGSAWTAHSCEANRRPYHDRFNQKVAPACQEEDIKEGARKIMRIIRRKMRNRERTAGERVEDVDG